MNMETPDKVTLRDVYEVVARLESKMEKFYVTKDEFWPVRTIVYGGAGIVLLGVFTLIVSLVTKH